MNLDPNPFFASLLVSGIGFVAFSYGKTQKRVPQFATGIVMMVYPYFIDGVVPMLVIGVVLVAAMTAAIKLGY